MQITISARHGHLSESTQEKIREKVEKLRRILDRVTAINVTVDLERREAPTVEIRASAEHHQDCVATNSAGNVLTALDLVIPKVEQQLRKNKEKRTGRKVISHKHLEAPPESEADTE